MGADAERAPGRYVGPDGTSYRVVVVPGRAAMRFTERRDDRWRVVPDLPPEALPRPGDVPAAFAEIDPVPGDFAMTSWLTLLEQQRDTVRAGLLALVGDHDLEWLLVHDHVDMDWTLDVAAAAEAARPVLLALEDAIDLVRECIDRPRGSAR